MSLEVAEHVSENRAQAFVAFLCELSDAVLFSAAVEGQGGTNHINEQWQSYWIELFKQNGFHYTLALREQVWEISEINPFYRQNILLFYKPDSIFSAPIASIPHKEIINVVHPQQYANREVYIDAWKNKVLQPGIRFSLDYLIRALRRKVSSYLTR